MLSSIGNAPAPIGPWRVVGDLWPDDADASGQSCFVEVFVAASDYQCECSSLAHAIEIS
jgi:hypothetical protein